MEAKVIKIVTPKNIALHGFIFGPKRAKTIYIFFHGLSGNLFSRIKLVEKMAVDGAAAMVFDNRGHGLINKFRKINPKNPEEYETVVIGQVHEVFEDCVDDIDGTIKVALEQGYKKIILVGHSTGCNKISYYLSKKSPAAVEGAVLLAPMSDYADTKKFTDPKVLAKATLAARNLVKAGKPHELLPKNLWPNLVDAQRFLSLFTPESKEEIFSYAVPTKKPSVMLKIQKPLLVILAGEDQFTDRPMIEIFTWFKKVLANQAAEVLMIKKSLHSFSGHETKMKKIIFDWMKSLR
jgi:alpha-beta hydrolase superfamily lysophospholipase